MKQRLGKKLKQNKGFTLMEMMIALAVMIVLMAIAFVSISSITKTLKFAELDNYAKTIYMETQYHLTAKKIEGGLDKFYESIDKGRFLERQPQDYDEDKNGDDWKQLCYIQAGDTYSTALIPVSSTINDLGGSFLIELNPQTGDVYGVFYWESSDKISYDDNIETLLDRGVEERSIDMLGYYGGETDTTVSTEFSLEQEVSVVNSEELYLKIEYEYSARLLKYYADALTIECVVTDEHGNSVTFTEDDFESSWGENLEYVLLLDSAEVAQETGEIGESEKSYHFKDITGGVLVPGDNLTIDVKSVYDQGAYHDEKTANGVKCNSLFEHKADDSSETIIQVGAVRHLLNLNAEYYTADANSTYKIQQAKDIDFAGASYSWSKGEYVGSGNANRPYNSIAPIINGNLFVNTGADSDVTTIDGNGFEIKNLVVTGTTENVGVLATANHVDLVNVKIEDIAVNASGYNNVGTLVGTAENCSFDGCGVYLTNTNPTTEKHYIVETATSGTYDNEMERRYDQLCINGSANVGGLAGILKGCTVNSSFAAVKVKGSSNIGGLVGNAIANTKITNSYSSGDVRATIGVVGGFVGKAESLTVTNAYSTGNVYAPTTVGGFIGSSSYSKYDTCNSYGQVLALDGVSVPSNAGGFIYSGATTGDTFTVTTVDGITEGTCRYLQQQAYNNLKLSNPDNIVAQGYSRFAATDGNTIANGQTYAYASDLVSKAFPFVPVTDSHYGNWPSQYLITSSLVYYERYADNTYGYYCVTTFSDSQETDGYIWVLDTLQERECIEDGYALLSMYNLSKFSYNVYVGSVANVTASGTLTVTDTYSTNATEAKSQAVRLRQQTALKFSGYKEQLSDYTNVTPEDYFVVDGMYLYQLPYDLQCTGRTNVDNFYDKFVVYNGLAKGAESADPVVGGSTADKGVVFFYCPHFAKTAVNPNTAVNPDASEENKNKLINPAYVYVRSARQLNALGRNTYYWNDKQGLADKMTYVQETDINFGTYAKAVDADGNVKYSYCGQEYDLTKTDKPYSNCPIGVPAHVGTAEQFRNNYDGQGHRIIDYRVVYDGQFTGLFGEINNAKIENVVMTVSAPGEGYVISTCRGVDGTSNRPAVGALVGLAYEDTHDTTGNPEQNTINNCTAAGYTVEYQFTGGSIYGAAIGGLVGMSMSDVSNCSAENDEKLIVNNTFSYNVYMGGLMGSSYFGSLTNSYAGGTIDIEHSERLNGKVFLAGVCPGYLWTWYQNDKISKFGYEGANYENLYSYTTIKTNKYTRAYGVVGDARTSDRESNKTGTYYNSTRNPEITIKNCYYLVDAVSGLDLTPLSGVTGLSYKDLSSLTTMPNRASAVNTFPIDGTLKGNAYPFPALVANGSTYVHYGDWPLADGSTGGNGSEGEEPTPPKPELRPRNKTIESTKMQNNEYVGVFYYEKYDDGTYGIFANGLHSGDTTQTVLINTLGSLDEKVTADVVEESGYGVFYKNSGDWRVSQSQYGTYTAINQYGSASTDLNNYVNGYTFRIVTSGNGNVSVESYSRYLRNGTNIFSTRYQITILKSEFNRPNGTQ